MSGGGLKRVREEVSLWACSRDDALTADLEPLVRRLQRRRVERDRELSQQRSEAVAAAAEQAMVQTAPAAVHCSPAVGGHASGCRSNSSVSMPGAAVRQLAAPAAACTTWSSVQIDALRQELAAAERTVEELKAMLAEALQAAGRP